MKSVICILISLIGTQLFAQKLASFTLKTDKEYVNAPFSFPLDNINYDADSLQLNVYEITKSGKRFIPSQLEGGHTARLWFSLEGISQKNGTRKFTIELADKKMAGDRNLQVLLRKADGNLTLCAGKSPILSYRYAMMYPPEGVDGLFKRSGFIHPLWSPRGEVLSRVQPPDHYHHYGIWGPWTMTHIGDREVDFWNLNKGQGTVKFAGFISETIGDVFSGFKALQQHIDFGAKGEDQVAMNEVLDVRVWNTGNGVWMIDYTTSLSTPLENGITLDAYRYGGGIGYRATEKWTKENCTVLTSEGKTRIDADGSNARWCIVEGESKTPEGRSGILFLSHPSNRAHPEPMRVWPLDGNGGRGDMFFEFTPIRHQSWKLKNGNEYVLKYRMIVFDGSLDKVTAEKYWNSFSRAPEIEIQKNSK